MDLYQSIGGTPTCRQISETFYARVKQDPILRPLFPGKTLHCAIEAFAAFLIQFLGGPPEDFQRRWFLSLRESHQRFKLGPLHRDAWMKLMVRTLDEIPLEEPARAALRSLFEHSSAYLVDLEPPPLTHPEIRRRWAAQRDLDEIVAAIRHGDSGHAIALAETAANRSILSAILSLMIRSANPAMLDYVKKKLHADPGLARERYYNRTLLQNAAASGNREIVELLLPHAAAPEISAALYDLANQRLVPGAAPIVRALVAAGATPDLGHGSKRCTPLHMAARRGNVEIAQALLDCGAAIDPRDSLGVTPLLRAVNCRKPQVAALLRSRGAEG